MTTEALENDARDFYGDAFARGDSAKLVKAFTQLRLATNASSPGVAQRALDLACKTEREAFGVAA